MKRKRPVLVCIQKKNTIFDWKARERNTSALKNVGRSVEPPRIKLFYLNLLSSPPPPRLLRALWEAGVFGAASPAFVALFKANEQPKLNPLFY